MRGVEAERRRRVGPLATSAAPVGKERPPPRFLHEEAQCCRDLQVLALTHKAPLSMKFSKQECRSRLPFSFPGDLSQPGIEPPSPALAGRFFSTEPSGIC